MTFQLKLPTAPVDQYEVRWWRVDGYGDVPRIDEVVATYHVNTAWETLHPGDRKGAPFTDEWRIVVVGSGSLGSRGGPWAKLREYPWLRCYATEVEAAKAALQMLRDVQTSLERRLEAMKPGALELARRAFPDGEVP